MGNKNSTEGKNSTEDGEDGPKKVGFMKMVRDNYDLLCNGIIRPPRDEYEISGKSTILLVRGAAVAREDTIRGTSIVHGQWNIHRYHSITDNTHTHTHTHTYTHCKVGVGNAYNLLLH